MKIINETFKARTLFSCDNATEYEALFEHDPIWRQNVAGCFILHLLQDMFKFKSVIVQRLKPSAVDAISCGFNTQCLQNSTHSLVWKFNAYRPKITYLLPDQYQNDTNIAKNDQSMTIYPHSDDSVDIYVKAMNLETKLLDNVYPIQPIFIWRFGFIYRQTYNGLLKAFYSQPFSIPVWWCICCIIILSAIIFYILSVWDRRLYGIHECNLALELLLAFSAYCQHILPLQALSFSRRIAYLTFIMTAYVVHCFYTSNLLSHLVHDKNVAMDLRALAESDYKIALLKDMNLITEREKYEATMDKNLSIVWKKVLQLSIMDVPIALTAVMDSKTALLTDYIILYPILKRRFEMDEICQLVEIDLYSSVMYYFFTNKTFKYKEDFKIGSFRIKEAGLIRRKQINEKYRPLKCKQATNQYQYQAQLDYAANILMLLLAIYLVAFVILIGERIHYSRNRIWPYVN